MEWLRFDTGTLVSGAVDGLIVAVLFCAVYFFLLHMHVRRTLRIKEPAVLNRAIGLMAAGSAACIGWSAFGLWPLGILTLITVGFMGFKKVSASVADKPELVPDDPVADAGKTLSGLLEGKKAPDSASMKQTIEEAKKRYWYNRINIFAIVGGVAAIFILIAYLTRFVDTVAVVVAPDDAAQSAVVDITHGTTLSLGTTIWVLNRQLTLEVASPGFAKQTVTASDASFERGVIDVILQELPATVNASTTPSVEGTKWYLNDVLTSADSVFYTDLTPGTYTLRAEHPDFAAVSTQLTAERGKSHVINLEFETFEKQITVTSNPSGAAVELNSNAIGQTPLTASIRGGIHTIGVSADNYQSITETLRVTITDEHIERHYELNEAAVALKLTLKPQGGQFALNGQVQSPSSLGSIRLPVGSKHTASYSHQGFITKELQFVINSSSAKNITLDLDPEYGKVTIQSLPNANVAVNNQVAGRTPLELNLQTVSQTITLSEEGYVAQNQTVVPDPTKQTLVSVELASEKQHRIANAKGQYQNSIGMEMKLFDRPDSFAMGSPRGEKDRRVNEFERTVQLSRPFYAGLHEVTLDQFMLASNPNHSSSGSRLPATGMSWNDAAKFCNWLSKKEELQPVYEFSGDFHIRSNAKADGYRLLTEAEWEWLARKANRRKTSIFPWGDKYQVPPDAGNLADESAKSSVSLYIPNYRDGQSRLAETGLYPAESSGLHDLTGNAKEWTHDPYVLIPPDSDGTQTNPFDNSGQSRSHVIKGSSWRSASVSELRAAWRDGESSSADDVGFRVARYLYKEANL